MSEIIEQPPIEKPVHKQEPFVVARHIVEETAAFLKSVADTSLPWEEVKKRSTEFVEHVEKNPEYRLEYLRQTVTGRDIRDYEEMNRIEEQLRKRNAKEANK